MIPILITRRSLLKVWLGLGLCLAPNLRASVFPIPKATSTDVCFEDHYNSNSAGTDNVAYDMDQHGMEFEDQTCVRCNGTGYMDEPWYLLHQIGTPHPCEPCRGSGYLSIDGGGFPWGPGGNGWI
jgi:hypothetical protein